ncbi:MAG: AEC family transporter [Actinomycetaceae bacterium]|nr:AEC family transporter [Actinomycetaceae bacterium]
MLSVLSATVPIFAIVLLGYVATRLGMFARKDMAVLNVFVSKIGLPLLVFVNVSGSAPSEVFQLNYIGVYAGTALVMLGLSRVYGRARRLEKTRTAFTGLTVAATNHGFMGLPMLLILFPSVAGAAVGMTMIVENVLTIPLTLFLAEAASGHEPSIRRRLLSAGYRVVTHPLILAITLALVFSGLGVRLPAMVDRSVTLLAQTSSGVALFAIGGMLFGMKAGHMVVDALALSFGKLVVMPGVAVGLIVLGNFLAEAGFGFALLGEFRAAAVLVCALPSLSVTVALSEKYAEGEYAAAAVLMSTALSFFTMTTWMYVLTLMGWLL